MNAFFIVSSYLSTRFGICLSFRKKSMEFFNFVDGDAVSSALYLAFLACTKNPLFRKSRLYLPTEYFLRSHSANHNLT